MFWWIGTETSSNAFENFSNNTRVVETGSLKTGGLKNVWNRYSRLWIKILRLRTMKFRSICVILSHFANFYQFPAIL